MTRRSALAAFAGVAGIALAACSTPTDSGPPLIALTGNWTYAADQTSPTTATLEGTLTITHQAGKTFSGSFAGTLTDSASHPVSGLVTGTTPDSQSVDFDTFFGGVDRRHVAAVVHDSMKAGTWVDFVSGAPAGSGSFAAQRVP